MEYLENVYNDIAGLVGTYVPNLVGALLILIVGWIVVKLISGAIGALLRKTGIDDKFSGWMSGGKEQQKVPVSRYIAKTLYYILLIFVLVAFFQTLKLTIVTEPLNNLLNTIFTFAPQLLSALFLVIIAVVIATILKMLVEKGLSALNLDKKLSEETDKPESEETPISKTIATAVYWLVLLLFLPAVLDTLNLDGLLAPVQNMVDEILSFLPNLLSAALIIVIGWFVASIVRKVLTNLLAAVGTDNLTERVGMTSVMGSMKLSQLIGLIVYVIILVPVVIAGMQALQLDAVTEPAMNMLNIIFRAIPGIFTAALILVVAYIVGNLVSKLAASLLAGVGFNKLWMNLGLSKEEPKEGEKTAADFAGYIILVAVMFFASIEAAKALQLEQFSELLAGLLVFGGNILLGLVIFGLALFLANLIGDRIKNSGSAKANFYSALTKILILVLAGFMALEQMGFGQDIVELAFGLSLAAIAIAFAVAFGIGGRDMAAKQLKKWVEDLEEQK